MYTVPETNPRISQEVSPDLRQVADDIVGPDVWQAADDILQGKTDVQSAAKEAAELWSDVKQAVSGLGGGGGQTTRTTAGGAQEEATAGLGCEGLKKDLERAAAGVFGSVRKNRRVLDALRMIG